VTEEQVLEKLRTCYDPEIPVNIVDLGLVYDLQIQPLPAGGSRVEIKMTLTAPGCGMGPVLQQDVERKFLHSGRQGSRRVPGLGPALEPRHALRSRPARTWNDVTPTATARLGRVARGFSHPPAEGPRASARLS
jgi:metal-sulfur cluster biosynthetic enzyme